jgi:hypothetical protein
MMRSSRKAQRRKRANRLPFSDENNIQGFFTGRAFASATLVWLFEKQCAGRMTIDPRINHT